MSSHILKKLLPTEQGALKLHPAWSNFFRRNSSRFFRPDSLVEIYLAYKIVKVSYDEVEFESEKDLIWFVMLWA